MRLVSLRATLTGSARGALPGLFALVALVPVLAACSGQSGNPGPPPPPPEVSVIQTVAQPVTVYEEYVAQTEAVDTVEIRARVGGILERQAYVDGARVKKGDLLFVIDPQPFVAALAQAKAALALAQANHVNSRQVLERIRPLLAEQAVSQQELDSAIAREGVDAANVEAARAQLKTAELNLDYTTIRAARDGVIGKALVKPGGLVNASTTLLTTLYSIDPIYVNFTVSEQRLLELQRRLDGGFGGAKGKSPPYKLRLADGSDYKFSGRLNFVDAAVDARSGTLQVRLSVPNPGQSLRAGQFVRVTVAAAEHPAAIRLPQRAVQEMQGKRSVLVVDGDNKVAFREIVANTRLDHDWVVEGGLKPGERVIVEGTHKVRPGMMVKPVPAAGRNGKDTPARQQPAASKPKG